MRPSIVYLVSEDWYFLSHRLPMARAARDAGYAVHVITRVVNGRARIEREGFVVHDIDWRRGSLQPLHLVCLIVQIRKLYRRIRPDIVHHVAIAAAVLGSAAALGLPIAKVNALAGLGFVFTSTRRTARLLRPIARWVLKMLLSAEGATALVQNPDDLNMLGQLGIPIQRIRRIPGSGIDTVAFQPLPDPALPFVAAFVGRLLVDKGLPALIAAIQLLQQKGLGVRLIIAGEPDPANPASVPEGLLRQWRELPNVTFLGHVRDIHTVWAKAHVAVLPSLREGLPLTLLEAAACERAIVATDVPGCREIARQDVNAELVPTDDPAALAAAIERLVSDPELRHRYAINSRRIAETEFSSVQIGQQIVMLYRQLSDRSPDDSIPQPELTSFQSQTHHAGSDLV